MNKHNYDLISQYEKEYQKKCSFVQENHKFLNNMKFSNLFEGKNLYLFPIRNAHETAGSIIKKLIDEYIYFNEDAMFGDWLEGLAIFINQKVYGGWKSGITGIDLEFDKDNIRYIVSIKSSPNWGNSRQVPKMQSDFSSAKKTLRTSNSKLNIVAVNGCCYGRDNKPDKGDYFKYCGQEFWAFISGNENLYLDIIEPLGHKATERNKEYQILYSKMVHKFTLQFLDEFCNENGEVDWQKLVKFNSGRRKED